MKIDITGFVKIGDMLSGGGLAATSDDDIGTTGYVSSPQGWAGVIFPAPTKVEKVVVTSAGNGFDASGLTTSITLNLRAKTGAAPISRTDGTVLATQAFTDQNVQYTKSLTSNDVTTEWDHVWVDVQTGSWSVIAEIEVYEPDVASAPEPLSSTNITIMQKSCDDGFMLPQTVIYVPGFYMTFNAPVAGVAMVDFVINLTHKGDLLPTPFLGAVGIGAELFYKYSTDFSTLEASPWVGFPISQTNGINIDDRDPAHYANVSLNSSLQINPGFYKFGIRMSGHTTGTTQDFIVGILAESGKGLNGFRITYIPGADFFNMNI